MQDQINALGEKLGKCKDDIKSQLTAGESRMDSLETNLTNIESKIDTVLELFDDFKGFFKVMGWVGRLTIWAAKVGAVLWAFWFFLKDHVK